ncbi:sodium-dependent transporter [Tamilnaduibacter salinus]|uniref:Sodium-dependent transporter n=1 Tax=Tamilnaduibacter salinus TaxID=1484056 RepID=A0A2A2I5X8_9GAMM|nr:sodium-dependent transporter [Tamilnaduibacter salinus]PAV26798.1 sodium-dependent transporter [Tamilnaduibacter salinus]
MDRRNLTPAGSWVHRMTFFWAATGATAGLSNFWTFPGLVAERGGSLFLFVYLVGLLLITLPLMLTEAAIGRYARFGPVLAFDRLAGDTDAPGRWLWVAWLGVFSGFLVLAMFAVIGGICLYYLFHAALGEFNHATESSLLSTLDEFVRNPEASRAFMGWHAVFLLLVVAVSAQGVWQGLGRAMRVMVPLMVLLLSGLLIYSARDGEFARATSLMLDPHWADFSFESVRLALTHAFYTLGLGVGVLIVFGAYSAPTTPLKRSVFTVALSDTLIGIMAGLVVHSLVTASEVPGLSGFELVFLALPESLASVPGGQFLLTVFFMMVTLAAWTSALALMEPAIGWLRDRLAAPRRWTVLIIGVAAWLAGLMVLFSFNVWSDDMLLGGTAYRWMDIVSSAVLIPAVCILTSFFVGWALADEESLRLIGHGPALVRQIWLWVTRLVLPTVILYIAVHHAMASAASLCDGAPSLIWCGH